MKGDAMAADRAASNAGMPGSGAASRAAPPALPDAVVEARLQAIARELRCLVCQNESLADSQAGLAADLRQEIREMVAAGRSDEQVVAFLVARYGDFVRYRPPLAPRTWLLWGGPAVGAVGGLLALAWVVRRRQRVPAAPPLDATERARAQALLAGAGDDDEDDT